MRHDFHCTFRRKKKTEQAIFWVVIIYDYMVLWLAEHKISHTLLRLTIPNLMVSLNATTQPPKRSLRRCVGCNHLMKNFGITTSNHAESLNAVFAKN